MRILPFLTTNEYDDIGLDLIVLLESRGYTLEEIKKIFEYALERVNET